MFYNKCGDFCRLWRAVVSVVGCGDLRLLWLCRCGGCGGCVLVVAAAAAVCTCFFCFCCVCFPPIHPLCRQVLAAARRPHDGSHPSSIVAARALANDAALLCLRWGWFVCMLPAATKNKRTFGNTHAIQPSTNTAVQKHSPGHILQLWTFPLKNNFSKLGIFWALIFSSLSLAL